MIRFVLDTNVIVAGLRSPTGASAALLDGALSGSFVLVLSVPLALEYEAVCQDPAQRIVSGLSETEVDAIVTALCAVAERLGRGSCGARNCTTRRTRWCSTRPSTVRPTPW